MGYLIKSDVINAIHEAMETSLFCYGYIEREIDKLSQYRLENVSNKN